MNDCKILHLWCLVQPLIPYCFYAVIWQQLVFLYCWVWWPFIWICFCLVKVSVGQWCTLTHFVAWEVYFISPSVNMVNNLHVCFFTDRGSQGALDLTELIGVPLPPSVSFVTGFEGYPAYSFGPDANVGRLTKSFIPDPFYYDFAVTVIAKPTTRRGGVLFAVTDAYQKVRHCDCISLHLFFFSCLFSAS